MLPEEVLVAVRLTLHRGDETVVVVPDGCPAVEVAVGGPRQVTVTPSQVLRPVLLAGASAYVLVHTHPCGGPPSPHDVAVTRRLVAASVVVGVRLRAHLVIAPDGQWDCLAA